MADPPMLAASGGQGGGPTPKRRASDRDPSPEPTTWTEIKADLMEEVRRLDGVSARRLTKELTEKMDAQHRELMTAIGGLKTDQQSHSDWIKERDKEREAEAVQRHNQEQREIGQAELRRAAEAKRLARKKRWRPVMPVVFGAMATIATAEIIWVIDNLDHLAWNTRTQGIAVSLLVIIIAFYVVMRLGM